MPSGENRHVDVYEEAVEERDRNLHQKIHFVFLYAVLAGHHELRRYQYGVEDDEVCAHGEGCVEAPDVRDAGDRGCAEEGARLRIAGRARRRDQRNIVMKTGTRRMGPSLRRSFVYIR